VAGLEIARRLGVSDSVVGIWGGALLLMTYFFSAKAFERLKWTFRGYKTVCAIAVLSIVPWIMTYIPADGRAMFLCSMAAGAAVFAVSQIVYQKTKAANGGHPHFPFEKVAMAVAALAITSIVFYYI
jgi:hypothetical protein